MPTEALADAASAWAGSSWSAVVSLRTRLMSASRMAYAHQKTESPSFRSADVLSDFALFEDSDKPSHRTPEGGAGGSVRACSGTCSAQGQGSSSQAEIGGVHEVSIGRGGLEIHTRGNLSLDRIRYARGPDTTTPPPRLHRQRTETDPDRPHTPLRPAGGLAAHAAVSPWLPPHRLPPHAFGPVERQARLTCDR